MFAALGAHARHALPHAGGVRRGARRDALGARARARGRRRRRRVAQRRRPGAAGRHQLALRDRPLPQRRRRRAPGRRHGGLDRARRDVLPRPAGRPRPLQGADGQGVGGGHHAADHPRLRLPAARQRLAGARPVHRHRRPELEPRRTSRSGRMFGALNDYWARGKQVLQQGRPRTDVAVYRDGFLTTAATYQALGTDIPNYQLEPAHRLRHLRRPAGRPARRRHAPASSRRRCSTARRSSAPATRFEYVDPVGLRERSAGRRAVPARRRLPRAGARRARAAGARRPRRSRDAAERGLAVVVVGEPPGARARGGADPAAEDARVQAAVARLLRAPRVRARRPRRPTSRGALAALGVAPGGALVARRCPSTRSAASTSARTTSTSGTPATAPIRFDAVVRDPRRAGRRSTCGRARSRRVAAYRARRGRVTRAADARAGRDARARLPPRPGARAPARDQRRGRGRARARGRAARHRRRRAHRRGCATAARAACASARCPTPLEPAELEAARRRGRARRARRRTTSSSTRSPTGATSPSCASASGTGTYTATLDVPGGWLGAPPRRLPRARRRSAARRRSTSTAPPSARRSCRARAPTSAGCCTPGANELRVVVATTLKNKLVALARQRLPGRGDLPGAAGDPAVRAARPGPAGPLQP